MIVILHFTFNSVHNIITLEICTVNTKVTNWALFNRMEI